MCDTNQSYNKNFKPIPVGALLNGKYHFIIPSFQRGYRWDEKQVLDLINDLKKFIKFKQNSYFLQPLVVKEVSENEYKVLDGQQRLTTMLILIRILYEKLDEDNKELYRNKFYKIVYEQRPPINFDDLESINPNTDIDSFFVYMAYRLLKGEVKKMIGNDTKYREGITHSIFFTDNSEPLVKFIWYVVNSENDLSSIKIFNNLNKGKISLTSSELIKALFILNREKKENHNASEKDEYISNDPVLQKINLEWDQMEKKFEDENFWMFISNGNDLIQTRIDVLFDFLTQKEGDDEDYDYSYRIFQKIFDGEADDSCPSELRDIKDFDVLWDKVKEVYNRMLHWYEDVNLYNYIGCLVKFGYTPYQIYVNLQNAKNGDINWDYDKTLTQLRFMIKSYFSNQDSIDAIMELRYNNGDNEQKLLRKALFLFNIESYNLSGMKFPFALYKKEGWDLEHIDSQTENNIVENEDRLRWLKFVIKSLKMENTQSEINKVYVDEAVTLGNSLYEQGKDTNNQFPEFYKKIVKYYSDSNPNDTASDDEDKHTIDNLALLDQSTNRSYHNAPFPYKRHCIIERDKKGLFVPICTKNLFLKYYSSSDKAVSQLENMRWRKEDRRHYAESIKEILGVFFNEK
jgi:uncharacterized protein with ParB-like and HNH nuclease domain